MSRTGQTPSIPLTSFYCVGNSFATERSSPAAIRRSLVRQLPIAANGLHKTHGDIFNACEQRKADAQLTELDLQTVRLEECGDSILQLTAPSSVVIVMDVINEIAGDGPVNSAKRSLKHHGGNISEASQNGPETSLVQNSDETFSNRHNTIPQYLLSKDQFWRQAQYTTLSPCISSFILRKTERGRTIEE
ncbi:hypothetical protein GQ43DRAFT_260231 [Delitschia confertaspora ATCC 74209]|uniref:Uncharacterized protein n=1 Tax=Delitschia confertaspora ATCC 74209 TaxID=1513339 RepID=A0A9P4MXR7_9PLEO|nr:hypothetical protein GQ43DRAFT_260231 [Delitschia confertaspora ATCC 74209]